MNEKEFLKLIEALRNTLRCPLCGKIYDPNEVRFLGSVNTAYLLEMNCKECELIVMATVLLNPNKNRVELIKKVTHSGENTTGPLISSDELINAHKFFDNFNGDFKALFKSEK